MTPQEAQLFMRGWSSAFKDYPYSAVEDAVNEFVMTDTKGFPPVPGQLAAIINKNVRENEEPELNPYEAWNLVAKTMMSGLQFDLQEKFDALPQLVKEAVGSPSVLREWSLLESGIEYVQHSFEKRYREIQQYEEDRKSLPGYTIKQLSQTRYLTE